MWRIEILNQKYRSQIDSRGEKLKRKLKNKYLYHEFKGNFVFHQQIVCENKILCQNFYLEVKLKFLVK